MAEGIREREQRQMTITTVAMVVEAPKKEDARTAPRRWRPRRHGFLIELKPSSSRG
jgi:hypothetical protein